MVPSKVVKAKVKLPADRKTKQDKELEAGMAAALEKEDFYGKKKKEGKTGDYLTKTYKTVKESPKRGDYLTETSKTVKENMRVPAFMEKIGKDAINQRIVEERTKQIRESMKKNPKGVIFRSVEVKKK